MKLPLISASIVQRPRWSRSDTGDRDDGWLAGVVFGQNGQAAILPPSSGFPQGGFKEAGYTAAQSSAELVYPQNELEPDVHLVLDGGAFKASAVDGTSNILTLAQGVDLPSTTEAISVSSGTSSPSSSASQPTSPSATASATINTSFITTTRPLQLSTVSSTTTSAVVTPVSSPLPISNTPSASLSPSGVIFTASHEDHGTSPSIISLPNPSMAVTYTSERAKRVDQTGKALIISLVAIAALAIIVTLSLFVWRNCSNQRQRRRDKLSEVVFPWSYSGHRHGGTTNSSSASSYTEDKIGDDKFFPVEEIQPPRAPGFLVKTLPTTFPRRGRPGHLMEEEMQHRRFASTGQIPAEPWSPAPAELHLKEGLSSLHRRQSLPAPHGHPQQYLHVGELGTSPVPSPLSTASEYSQPDGNPNASPWLTRQVRSRPNSLGRMILRDGELVPAMEAFAGHNNIRSIALPPIDEPTGNQTSSDGQHKWASAFKAGMAAAVASVATGSRAILGRRPEPDESLDDPYTRMPKRASTKRRTVDVERDGTASLGRVGSTSSLAYADHHDNSPDDVLTRNRTTLSRESDSSTAVAPSDNEYSFSPKVKFRYRGGDMSSPSIHAATPFSRSSSSFQHDGQGGDSLARSNTAYSTATVSDDLDDGSISDEERRTHTLLMDRRKRYLRKTSGIHMTKTARRMSILSCKSTRRKPPTIKSKK